MKILFLHMTMGLVNRGSEISTAILAEELTKEKHDVLVIQSGSNGGKKGYKYKVVHPLDRAPDPAPHSLMEKLAFRFYLDANSRAVESFTYDSLPTIAQFSPDIIVATNGYTQLKVLRHAKVNSKIVVFNRAGIGHHAFTNLSTNPDLYIALSKKAYNWAKKNKSTRTRVVYIPNPIQTKAYSSAKPINQNMPRPIVLTVAALSTYKNVIQVVRAIKPLNVSFILIGDGQEADNIQNELSSFPGDFRWIRAVEPDELPRFYASADVFCFLPEAQEAFGRVYLEAMAVGLPIVASDDPIRRDIVGQNGLFADPNNLDDIREKIILAVNKSRLDYSDRLRYYSLESVIKKIIKEFNGLLK